MAKITLDKKGFENLLARKFGKSDVDKLSTPPKEQQVFFALIESRNILAVELWDAQARLQDDAQALLTADQLQGAYTFKSKYEIKHLYEPAHVIAHYKGDDVDKFQRNLERTAIIIKDETLNDILLQGRDFAEAPVYNGLKITREFPYYTQKFVCPCYGSGFLLTDNYMLTAGHVLSMNNLCENGSDPEEEYEEEYEERLKGIRIIRDFKGVPVDKNYIIPPQNVYRLTDAAITSITHGTEDNQHYNKRYNGDNEDWAWVEVIRVDGETDQGLSSPEGNIFSLAPRLPFYQANPEGNKVYCLGHPLGLPVKACYRGMITSGQVTGDMFICRLSTLPGNSGSPVFDANTHDLIGIVSGHNGLRDDLSEKKEDEETVWAPTFFLNNYHGTRVSRLHIALNSLLDSLLYRKQPKKN